MAKAEKNSIWVTKDEAVRQLREKGYNAFLEHGVVMVPNSEITWEKLKRIMKEIGYCCSFGVCAGREK